MPSLLLPVFWNKRKATLKIQLHRRHLNPLFQQFPSKTTKSETRGPFPCKHSPAFHKPWNVLRHTTVSCYVEVPSRHLRSRDRCQQLQQADRHSSSDGARWGGGKRQKISTVPKEIKLWEGKNKKNPKPKNQPKKTPTRVSQGRKQVHEGYPWSTGC